MGYINQLSCQCGYKAELWLGTGRKLPDEAYVKEHFSADKLKEFNAAKRAGCLGQLFYIENTMSYCKTCKTLKQGQALHFHINQKEKIVYGPCHTCGHELQLTEDCPVCPLCGKELKIERKGLWD